MPFFSGRMVPKDEALFLFPWRKETGIRRQMSVRPAYRAAAASGRASPDFQLEQSPGFKWHD
ncbi:hypothetical protein BIZ35_06800 [Heyndrickxia coagulans]|uniref:Uncharacterized protein n=2 Tax=Heyndrickxia coagulans TaxID=1398 RepID=A0A150JPX5_HEYCO|nr:hypothetical protein BIZ35_06800 [Heyndrickxia coagulans]KYC59343.1 hypothetical protein B4098_2584 [Heyndrickxia coagulans]